jgi:hypothetical protein
MTQLFQDTFHRADGAPGNGWSQGTSVWDIFSNELRSHSGLSTNLRRAVDAGAQTDGIISVTLSPNCSYATGVYLRVTFRSDQLHQNAYYVTLWGGALGTAHLDCYKVVGTVVTTLQSSRQFALTGGSHVLTITYVGSFFVVALDGTTIAFWVDGDVGSGAYAAVQANGTDAVFLSEYNEYSAAVVSMTVSPTVVPPDTAGNVLNLYGSSTSWTSGVPGSPAFTVSEGTITYQHVLSPTEATLTYTSPTYATTVTITDPDSGDVALLAVTSATVPPVGPSFLPNWLVKDIAALVAGDVLVLGILGYDFTNNFIARIVNELGVDVDEMPTDGHVKAILAALLLVQAQLDTDTTAPDSVRHLLTDILTEATDAYASGLALSDLGTHSLQDVLSAIGALSFSTLTNADLTTMEDNIMGSTPYSIMAIKEFLDALTDTQTYSLGTLVTAIAALPSVVDLAAAVTSLEGVDARDLSTVYDTAEAARAAGVAATVAAAAINGVIAAAILTIGGLLTAQTATIEASIVAAVAEIDASIVAATADIIANIGGLASTLGSITINLAEANADLDELLLAVAALKPGPPVWPGASAVTSGTPVAVAGDQRVTAPMDGCLLNLTTIPSRNVYWTASGLTNVERAGFLVFCADNGYADERQPIAWSQGIYTPKKLLTAASVVIHLTGLAAGTLTPWVRT